MAVEIERSGPWIIVAVAVVVLGLTLFADREPTGPAPGGGAGVQAPRDLSARPCTEVDESFGGLSQDDAQRLLGEPGQIFLDPTTDGFAIYHAPETGDVSDYFLTPNGLEPTDLGLDATEIISFPILVSVSAPHQYDCFDEFDL